MENGNKSWDVLGDSQKHGPWAEIGKCWQGKQPIRLQDSLHCPLRKKIKNGNNNNYFLSTISTNLQIVLNEVAWVYKIISS